MATLYELTEQMKMLLELAQDESVDDEAFKDTLEGLEGEIEAKADGYACVIKELDAEEYKLSKEIERLVLRKNKIKRNVTSLKKNLESAMIQTGKTNFKTDKFAFRIQKNAPSLVLADDIDFDSIPAEFIHYPAPTIINDLVKNSIKAGNMYDWARLEQSESLRIR